VVLWSFGLLPFTFWRLEGYTDAGIDESHRESCDVSDFRDLKVWQKAHALGLAVYRIANNARAPAFSSLRSQTIRAALSIAANIAEGRGLKTDKEQVRYLKIAIGSCYELESHLITSRDVSMITELNYSRLLEQLVEVRKMLFGLIRYLDQ